MIVDAIALLLCFPLDKGLEHTHIDPILYANVIQIEKKDNEECYWITIDKQT